MKKAAQPLRSTIVWALLSGIVYHPLIIVLSIMVPRPLGFHLLLWVLLSGYGVLLSCWAGKSLQSVALPLLLLLFAALFIQTTTAFLIAGLIILSWVRSGVCFNRAPVVKRFAAEAGLAIGAGLLGLAAVPAVTLSEALGVWLLFLIQALYFVVFEYHQDLAVSAEVDLFECAKMAAEQILSDEVV